MDDISVIIRVRNEENWLGHSIQSILDNFKHPEIIIIDNNSNDKSIKIANLFKHDTSLPFEDERYTSVNTISIKDYTPGKAINLGVKNASRKNILIISAHCVIKNLNRNDLFLKLDNYPALFGKQIPHYYGKRLKPIYIWSQFSEEESINMYSDLENRYFFHNAFSFFRRSFLEKFPMNEELVGKEDRYWAHKIVSEGHSYLYDPSFVCNHHFTEEGNTWKGIG